MEIRFIDLVQSKASDRQRTTNFMCRRGYYKGYEDGKVVQAQKQKHLYLL